MLNEQELEHILSVISTTYESLEDPQFFFVNEVIARCPYNAVIRQLEQWFLVEEDTDLNADVSFQYILKLGDNIWSLQLSMLGPYAAIYRVIKPGAAFKVLAPNTTSLSEADKVLMQVLRDNGILVLDQETLEYPVSLRLSYTEPGNTRIYQALFGDYDVLPWE